MITIYGSQSCPRCEVLEEKLKSKNIIYNKSYDTSELEGMGFTQLPVIKMDDKYLTFKEMNEYIKTV